MAKVPEIERNAAVLRDIAMAYPEAHEDHPWGEIAVKVRGKAFLFMHAGAESLSLSCKLPASHEMALMLPFAKPTGYGLGKSGWVSASFTANERPPIDLLREWIDESYRAIAPKKLSAGLAAQAAGAAAEKVGVAAGGGKQAAKKVGAGGGKQAAKKVGVAARGGKKAAKKVGVAARGGKKAAKKVGVAAGGGKKAAKKVGVGGGKKAAKKVGAGGGEQAAKKAVGGKKVAARRG